MSMIKEFKTFAMKGNVIDLAVGVIIGAAFGKVVTSVVNDIIMPPIGRILGGVDFSNLFISLNGKSYDSLKAAQGAGAPTVNYGLFINNVIDFVIVAFAVFMLVRVMNRLKSPEAPPAPNLKKCPECLMEIPLAAKRCAHCTSVLA